MNGGYTLIETMIAVSLFVIVVTAGMGALLNANLLHEKSKNLRSIMDNLNFVMEDMSRNIRTGYNYQCFDASHLSLSPTTLSTPLSCASGWAIAFEYANGNPATYTDQWVYYINGGKIYKSVNGAQSFVQLTPDEVTIDQAYAFSVLGAEPPPGDSQQPLVNIRLIGHVTYKNVVSPFSLQTTVSQRQIDI
jgi:prepilin-type N-terminal cleavage/methylation domain-containing protein